MAKIPRLRELPQSIAGKAMEPLILKLNEYIRDVNGALDSHITVTENLAQCWVDVRVTEGTMPNPISLSALRGRSPHGVTVEHVEVVSGNLVEPVWVTWEEVRNKGASLLKLTSVFGLNTGTVINLRLLVKAE